ncbi:MAG TPA: hypothetical protein DEQ40_02105 [Oxalobacteraceae bacterium]|nr:hypothetical protein [Oxalobacteraceae bacterium]
MPSLAQIDDGAEVRILIFTMKKSASLPIVAKETPLPAYRVHWRTDLRWRSGLVDFFGHCDYVAALTPEGALEKFATDFPARMPVRIEAR